MLFTGGNIMKNIITILLILILPIAIYTIMSKKTSDISVFAKENNLPTLMTFTSTMCMDCQKMKTIFKEIEGNYTDKINFVHLNALDKNRKVQHYIKKHHVVLVPTMIFLDSNGNEINKIEGYIPKEELEKEIEEAVNG